MPSEKKIVVQTGREGKSSENDENSKTFLPVDCAMEKKNVDSIVAQRLALFRALERSRPRTDDGCPLTSNSNEFIFNSRLGKEIVSDFQLVNAQKSPNRHVAFDELLKNRPAGESLKNCDMENRSQNSDNRSVPAFSVRQLRLLFEGSSTLLTARNSAEEERAKIPQGEKSREACASHDEVPNSPKMKNGLKSVPVPKESPFENKETHTYENTMPIEMTSENKTVSGALKCALNMGGINAEATPIIPEKPRKFTTPSKPLPSLSSDSCAGASAIQVNRSMSQPPHCPPLVKSGQQLGAVGSSYVEPPSKDGKGMETPPGSEQKWKTVPMKQRTLGRGEIKPYEIVNIVNDDEYGSGVKNEGESKFRMESMYVETGGGRDLGEFKGGLRAIEGDGYQEIPEYDEPQQEPNVKLDADEWDLSNLDHTVTKNDMSGMAKEKEANTPVNDYESIGENRDENRNHLHHGRLLSDRSFDSGGSTLSSSILADISEGWDSDEFDEFTDDEILDGIKPQTKTSDADTAKKKIWNIVNEILATEKAYTKRLHLLEKFQSRLLKEAKENNVVPEKVVQEIFSNLSSICTFHATMLLPDLEKRIAEWSSTEKIGDIFKTLGHCLKLYTDYVKNFEHATTTLNQWMKRSPKFASIIEELQKQPECEHLTLQHHMLGPIQRVPRYRLLLQDYLKKLPKDSPDRAEAEESLSVISEAANHSNNSMKGMEQFKKLVEIEERILEGLQGESLATASRVFIKEGELTKIAARSDQRQARVLLLFNDLVLCCNKIHPVGKLKVRQMMEISGMTIQDMDEELGELNAFRIRSRQRVLDLAASSKEEKEEWMNNICNIIKDYEAKRGSVLKQHLEQEAQKESDEVDRSRVGESAPVWVKDEDVTMCMLCAVRFSLLSRRHHCRACGRIVCDNCSKYKAQLAYMNNTVKRVCYVCNQKLNAGKLQETNSYIQKSLTLQQVNRDPKRRRSTLVTEMKGELTWKAPGKGWAKGYFSISDMVLYVQKGRKDPKAQTTIALPGYTVTRPSPADEIDESKHPHTFKLYFGTKKDLTYYFRADTEEATQRWIDVITYATKAEKPPPQYKTL